MPSFPSFLKSSAPSYRNRYPPLPHDCIVWLLSSISLFIISSYSPLSFTSKIIKFKIEIIINPIKKLPKLFNPGSLLFSFFNFSLSTFTFSLSPFTSLHPRNLKFKQIRLPSLDLNMSCIDHLFNAFIILFNSCQYIFSLFHFCYQRIPFPVCRS
jgi:hypothetical protein